MIFSEFESIVNLFEKAKNFFSRRAHVKIPLNAGFHNTPAELDEARVNNQIAKRIALSLEMITDRDGKKFPNAWIGEYIGMEKPGDLEKIILGETEPTFQFLNHFAKCLGIDPSWLKSGQGEPFKIEPEKFMLWENYFEEIKAMRPEKIFFLRRRTGEGEAIIVLKLSKLKYFILPRIYHISDHVGGTGRRQIDGFCRLVEKLNTTFLGGIMCGIEVEKSELFELYEGKTHPSKLERYSRQYNHWWEDITDVMHEFPSSKYYEQLYGDAFIQAQRMVRFVRTGSLDLVKKG